MTRRLHRRSPRSRGGTPSGTSADATTGELAGRPGSTPESSPDGVNGLLSPEAPFQAFAIPVAPDPRVSIVIVVQEKPGWTVACLRSIANAGDTTSFEIIVVAENATPGHLHDIDGVRIVETRPGEPAAARRNTGARAARGELLLFMDDTAQATPGWLDRLCDCLDHEADCGMAGSRLVGADTRLRAAGGIIYADGTCRDAGYAEHRDDPRYRCRRDVDYLRAAALLIRRRLFESTGGFNASYALACHRDADLGLCVRAAGRRAIYEPSSVVLRGDAVAPAEPNPPDPHDRQRDRQAFTRAWPGELARQPAPGTAAANVLWRHQRHILVIDASTPDPARDATSQRQAIIFQLLRHLGWKVSLLPIDGQATNSQLDLLGTLGVSVWQQPFAREVSVWLHAHRADVQAVMLCCCDVARACLPLVRHHIPRARIVFDTVDLRFPRELRAAELSGNTALARQAQLSAERELALVADCDATLAGYPVERDLIAAHLPEAQVELVPGMHAPGAPTPGVAGRHGVLLIGNRDLSANADALHWLTREIMPQVRRQLPDIALHVFRLPVNLPEPDAKGVAIHVHDNDDDLETCIRNCRVLAAPVRYGAGMMGRVNMAMSRGLPVVATRVAVAGMNLLDGSNVLIGDDAASFAAALVRACTDDALWVSLSTEGLANVERDFSIRAVCAALQRALPA